MDRFGPTGKVWKKKPLLPVGPVGSLFKWIAPIEIVIHLAVAKVGEFVRDNASLGELR